MDPMSALISGGASLLGGLFADESAEKRARRQAQMAQKQFDAQMDETIQRRVRDARAAGLHPLFALGASPGASPTATISGQSDTGSHLGTGIAEAGRAISRLADPVQQAQVEQLRSQTDRNSAEADLLRSQAKRAEQTANSGGVRTFAASPPPDVMAGATKVVPVEIPARAAPGSAKAAGVPPLWQDVQVGVNPDGSPNVVTFVRAEEPTEMFELGPLLISALKNLGFFDPGTARKRGFIGPTSIFGGR